MIEKLQQASDWTEFNEVTPPSIGDRVVIIATGEHGEIVGREELGTLIVEKDDSEDVETDVNEVEVEKLGGLPMWGTMWAFSDSCDNWWLEESEGLQKMADCGFRIYESEEFGFIFGIDGAGYDFYESHWVPLYKARGLQWHDTNEENN